MKKVIFSIGAVVTILCETLMTSCTSSLAVDLAPPIITLQGNAEDVVLFKSASAYSDPGATAVDKSDGTLAVTASGTVNMNEAGVYTLTYAATDHNGNNASKTRKVIVDAAPYIAGTWTQVVTINGTTSPAENNIQIIASTMEKNKIIFSEFAKFNNANPDATVKEITFEMPAQSFICGNDTLLRTFTPESNVSFYGNATHATNFTIQYTLTENGVLVHCTSVYTLQ